MIEISEHINSILRSVFSGHDKTFSEIMINWPKIAGVRFSTSIIPSKITTVTEKGQKKKILHVKATNTTTSLEFTYHQNIILERIAVYFGHKAIDKLSIKI